MITADARRIVSAACSTFARAFSGVSFFMERVSTFGPFFLRPFFIHQADDRVIRPQPSCTNPGSETGQGERGNHHAPFFAGAFEKVMEELPP
jgi:hypothetical protein